MSLEVRCPDCRSEWRVDESARGEMLCPQCMTRIRLDRLPVAAHAEAPQGAAETARPSATIVPSPAAAQSDSAAPTLHEQVVCPRCNLHFQPRGRPAEPEVGRKCVLVVDDLAYFRQIAKDALEPTFDVKTAATSAQAREILARGGVDLLVLDLTLDGGDAGRDLLAELVPKPCPILIFTARDESEMYGGNWEQLKLLGADDLVIKGMQAAESLIRKVSGLLGVLVQDASVR